MLFQKTQWTKLHTEKFKIKVESSLVILVSIWLILYKIVEKMLVSYFWKILHQKYKYNIDLLIKMPDNNDNLVLPINFLYQEAKQNQLADETSRIL